MWHHYRCLHSKGRGEEEEELKGQEAEEEEGPGDEAQESPF